MALELKIHPSFFREFATKTWISTYEIIRELIENAFDEDATKVIVTVLGNGDIVIEDDAGMNFDSINKFLLLGSPHKSNETLSPKFKRIRTGRYGTGRLSFLTSFNNMKIKTKLDEFSKTMVINGDILENLIEGKAQIKELDEPTLKRNGTEILLNGSKIQVDITKLSREIKKLSILKFPFFEVYVKNSDRFCEWDISGAQIIKSPDVQGYKIIVDISNPSISGEIIIAKRPLGNDEKGIAIMVGNHMVLRSTFGFDNKLNRVTGYVKCDQLTSRFADKSALIEDDVYFKFNQSMKNFIIDQVLPSLTEYEDVLITREESKIYREVDKVMGQAVLETLQIEDEVQGFESVELSGVNAESEESLSINNKQNDLSSLSFSCSPSKNIVEVDEDKEEKVLLNKENDNSVKNTYKNHISSNNVNDFISSEFDNHDKENVSTAMAIKNNANDAKTKENDLDLSSNIYESQNIDLIKDSGKNIQSDQNGIILPNDTPLQSSLALAPDSHPQFLSQLLPQNQIQNQEKMDLDSDLKFYNPMQQNNILFEKSALIKRTMRKPILKKTFTLKKIGYKVIPYEDEDDSRYCFTNENIVFVNKAHSTYKVESERGDEFLFRHITNIVAEVVVGSKYPEARDILEIQNKLISEAIKLHDYSLLKK